MFAPIVKVYEMSQYTNFAIAFAIGIGFGFFLEQGGFGNARQLAACFYLRDMRVVKVMFTGVITAMCGWIILSHFGFLNMDLVWINPSHLVPGIVGGLIMGAGFAIGGYCPGTSVVGVATFKIDAIFNILGAFIGMFIFGELVPYFYEFYSTGNIGSRLTLYEYLGVSPGVVGFGVIIMALSMFVGCEWAERKFGEVEN